EIPSKIELRGIQKPWVNELLQHRQGIGVAPAGSGKTIMMLDACARLHLPILWLTHRTTLVNQIVERIGFFYGDIGNIGIIGGGKNSTGDVFTVAMIQTLAQRDLSDLSRRFGVVVLDEAHIVPAIQASKVIRHFSSRFLFGITATAFREDSLEQVIFDTIGPIITTMDRQEVIDVKGIMPAKIIVRKTGISSPFHISKDYPKVIDYLSAHVGRNNMILIDILSEVALGNVCIILTNRVAHGKLLSESLKALGTDNIHLHAGSTAKQRKEGFDGFKSDKVVVLIATYSFIAEGFDNPKTNRIFFALPHKARGLVIQARGRIERVFPGKEDAILYDYVDSIKMLKRQFESRLEQYEEHGLDIIF
ncbi:MAG: DEAD/DEAH box helicase family protein, partial [Candidatus Peribacteraceae bacterium]|nr:DEAD/DEAH box helicase family protein [Candidatus Peribacteraceae bacterium]